MPVPVVQSKTDSEIAALAYASVADIPTQEMNDRNRLGFHVYLYLTGNIDSVMDAVREARCRLHVSTGQAADTIRTALKAQGIDAV